MFLQDIDGHLVVGGGLPLNSVIKTFEENAGKSPFFEALAQHLKKVCMFSSLFVNSSFGIF